MKVSLNKGYSRYVSLMKIVLPIGIVLAIVCAVAWPYVQTLNTAELAIVDTSHPEIRENRMVHPHYLSTDGKGQPFQVDAEWAKNQSASLSDLVNPEGSMTVFEGETYKLKAKKGHYDSENKTLDLTDGVILTSTDGYEVKTQEAHVTIENKVIEGDSYIEGEGPAGAIMGKNGFKIENRPKGKKVITLKGPSRIVINNAKLKKQKEAHAQ